MASFAFGFLAIDAGTSFIFGSLVCVANGSGGFSSYLINPTNTRAPQQEQFGGTTSAEILLPEIAKEIENLSLSDSTPTCRCPDPGVRIPTSNCCVFPHPRC